MAKEMKVTPIDNGTVIDHIPAGMALKVISIIYSGREIKKPMSIVMNVGSSAIGRKDIVKVEDLELKKKEVNKISLIAPDACINIIRDSNVVEKRRVSIPKKVVSILKCSNPNCVSNQNEPIETEFVLTSKDPIVFQCEYCEREVDDIMEHLV